MRRDFIIVCGMQGFGKSAWTKTYAQPQTRLLLYDPKAEYARVDYSTPPGEWIDDVLSGARRDFRFGSYHADDVEMLGSTAYAAGNCTLILEECKMLFDRGEDVAHWARPLIYMGREPRVNLVLCAQRMTAIPPDIRSQASRMVSFLQTDVDDCRAFSQRTGEDVRDDMRRLEELECIDWQAGQGVRRYKIPYPQNA